MFLRSRMVSRLREIIFLKDLSGLASLRGLISQFISIRLGIRLHRTSHRKELIFTPLKNYSGIRQLLQRKFIVT